MLQIVSPTKWKKNEANNVKDSKVKRIIVLLRKERDHEKKKYGVKIFTINNNVNDTNILYK